MSPSVKNDLVINADSVNGFNHDNFFDGAFPITCVRGIITVRTDEWLDGAFTEKYLTPNNLGGKDVFLMALSLSDYESTTNLLTKLLGSNPPESDIHLLLNWLNYRREDDLKIFFIDETGFIKVNQKYIELRHKPES